MSKARSLHIGVPEMFRPNTGASTSFDTSTSSDARTMETIANSLKFLAVCCDTPDKTTFDHIRDEIRQAAKDVDEKGIFLLTFSGYGISREERVIGESIGFQESWVLSGGSVLYDDDLLGLFLDFKPGVRILIVSDSCYSGGMVDSVFQFTLGRIKNFFAWVAGKPFQSVVLMPLSIAKIHNHQSNGRSKARERLVNGFNRTREAHIILLAACERDNLAWVRDGQGVFTRALSEVLANSPVGSYVDFIEVISRNIRNFPKAPIQRPQCVLLPPENLGFNGGPPFKF